MQAAEGASKSLLSEFPELLQEDLGRFIGQPHKIKLQEEANPITIPLRPVPLALQDVVAQEIKLLDQQGVWEPVQTSEWAHPMAVVKKKDGGVRITSDLTTLNKFFIPEGVSSPSDQGPFDEHRRIHNLFKLDLRKGYFQVPLHPESRDFTTTITPQGLRRYTHLPMGLKDAASAFQCTVQTCL